MNYFWEAPGGSWEGLGRVSGALGGSWGALGELLERQKLYFVGLQEGIRYKADFVRIFKRFLKKIGNFGVPSWDRFNIKNRIFEGSKRVPNIKLILKAFWHRF